METTVKRIIILGAGTAGVSAAKKLHSLGYENEIVLISDEQGLPYDRPPLSKELLLGKMSPGDITQISNADILRMKIQYLTDRHVQSINTINQEISFSAHAPMHYDRLIIATGSRARKLDIASQPNDIYYLRTIEDSERITTKLKSSRHIAIIGGGWIGLELAAVSRTLGVKVTLLEAAPQLCGRSVNNDIATRIQEIHQSEGVYIRLESSVENIERVDDNSWKLHLDNGKKVHCDMVVAGIGTLPNTSLAEASGIDVDNGIVVDPDFKTSAPHVYAAGDVTNFYHCSYRRSIRLESYVNAQTQGDLAARACMGESVKYTEIPWFWSDQYEHNFQILGQVTGDAEGIDRGPNSDKGFLTLYLNDDRVVGAIALNQGREIRHIKKLIQSEKNVSAVKLRDLSLTLNSFL